MVAKRRNIHSASALVKHGGNDDDDDDDDDDYDYDDDDDDDIE